MLRGLQGYAGLETAGCGHRLSDAGHLAFHRQDRDSATLGEEAWPRGSREWGRTNNSARRTIVNVTIARARLHDAHGC